MIQRGIDVVLRINNKPVAGQQNAILNQSMSSIDITNKINGVWNESLAGTHTWRIQCNGLYVLNAESLLALESAFMNNEEISVSFSFGNKNYFGRALIIDYPLSSTYNAQFKYVISLLGIGELKEQ